MLDPSRAPLAEPLLQEAVPGDGRCGRGVKCLALLALLVGSVVIARPSPVPSARSPGRLDFGLVSREPALALAATSTAKANRDGQSTSEHRYAETENLKGTPTADVEEDPLGSDHGNAKSEDMDKGAPTSKVLEGQASRRDEEKQKDKRDDDEVPICRFCFAPEDGDASGLGHLISPCKCSGSQQYVHLACIRKWQRMVVKQRQTRQRICDVCKSELSCPPPAQEELLAWDLERKTVEELAQDVLAASAEGDVATLHVLLKAVTAAYRREAHPGVDLNAVVLLATDDEGNMPLHLAAFAGHADLALALLEGADDWLQREMLLSKGAFASTPLNLAAWQGHAPVAKALLAEAGMLPGQLQREMLLEKDEDGFTPLYSAAHEGHEPVVQALLEVVSEGLLEKLLLTKCGDGGRPLHGAARRGHDTVAVALIAAAPTELQRKMLLARDKSGRTAKDAATRFGHRGTAELLEDFTDADTKAEQIRISRGDTSDVLSELNVATENAWLHTGGHVAFPDHLDSDKLAGIEVPRKVRRPKKKGSRGHRRNGRSVDESSEPSSSASSSSWRRHGRTTC